MIESHEFFSDEDALLLEQDADRFAAENDLVGLQQMAEILSVLHAQPSGQHLRTITAAGPTDLVPADRLLDFDPQTALADDWAKLDAFTRDLLVRGADVREKLGAGAFNARGVGVYVAVAFEHEMRMRVEGAFDDFRRTRQPKATLRDLWWFLKAKRSHLDCPRISSVIDLRNCLVHPPTATGGRVFAAGHFNKLICQAGLKCDGRRGAFSELAALKL